MLSFTFRYQSLNLKHVPESCIQIYEFRWTLKCWHFFWFNLFDSFHFCYHLLFPLLHVFSEYLMSHFHLNGSCISWILSVGIADSCVSFNSIQNIRHLHLVFPTYTSLFSMISRLAKISCSLSISTWHSLVWRMSSIHRYKY